MPVNKYLLYLLLLLLSHSCIEPFQPEIAESQEVIVINGEISDRPGNHRVTISQSSAYNDPSFIPFQGCVVRVEDDLGNIEVYLETDPGIYESYLDEAFLEVNRTYSLKVTTPSGSEYQSSYDSLLACPPIDSLYFEVKSEGTPDPEVNLHGIQFYCDLNGTESVSRNFRWKLNETWQYEAPSYGLEIWWGDVVEFFSTEPFRVCYMSDPVDELFTGSTRALSQNLLRRNSLNYVSNETPRILRKYSLLVEQLSLTNEAFDYWDRMKSQSSDAGGLYETQPSSTTGNIYNVNQPEAKVLGCFYATQKQSRRITVENTFDFDIPRYTCSLDTAYSVADLGANFPYYLISISPMGVGPPWLYGDHYCFDCTKYGGTTEKPYFWEE